MQEAQYNSDISAMLAVLQARVAELEVLTESSFVQASSCGMLTGLNPQVWNDIEWSFKLRINQNGRLIRSAGWRCVADYPWEYVPEADHGVAEPGKTVVFIYTYGDPVGAWTEWVGDKSNVPVLHEGSVVVPIGTVMANDHYGRGPFWIMHRHIGDICIRKGAAFSGSVEVNGQWYHQLNVDPSKRYVVVPLDGSPPREEDGPMPNPNPVNEIWFPKATTYGDIHVGSNR